MIQVRDVPDNVHSTLKSRAAREHMSLSDFIKRELERAAERPTMQEWLERSRSAKPFPARTNAARLIRELRDERLHRDAAHRIPDRCDPVAIDEVLRGEPVQRGVGVSGLGQVAGAMPAQVLTRFAFVSGVRDRTG